MKSILVALSLVSAIAANARAPDDVVMVGQGSVTAPADQADISVTVTTKAATPREAVAANARAKSALENVIVTQFQMKAEDWKTVSISTHQVTKYVNNEAVADGYATSHVLTLCVRDLKLVGSIVDAVATVNAVQLNGVTNSSSKAEEFKLKAYRAAYRDARAKAEHVADEGGAVLQAGFSEIGEASYGGGRAVYAAARAEAALSDSTSINAQDLTFTASVTVTFKKQSK